MPTKRLTKTEALQQENERLRQHNDRLKQQLAAVADAVFHLIEDHVNDAIDDRSCRCR